MRISTNGSVCAQIQLCTISYWCLGHNLAPNLLANDEIVLIVCMCVMLAVSSTAENIKGIVWNPQKRDGRSFDLELYTQPKRGLEKYFFSSYKKMRFPGGKLQQPSIRISLKCESRHDAFKWIRAFSEVSTRVPTSPETPTPSMTESVNNGPGDTTGSTRSQASTRAIESIVAEAGAVHGKAKQRPCLRMRSTSAHAKLCPQLENTSRGDTRKTENNDVALGSSSSSDCVVEQAMQKGGADEATSLSAPSLSNLDDPPIEQKLDAAQHCNEDDASGDWEWSRSSTHDGGTLPTLSLFESAFCESFSRELGIPLFSFEQLCVSLSISGLRLIDFLCTSNNSFSKT